MNKLRALTRGIKNCRDSRLFKGCSPLLLLCNWIGNRPQSATFHTAKPLAVIIKNRHAMIKSKIWLISLIGLLIFLIFIPREIMYPDFKIISWTIFGLIFGLIPFLVFKTIQSFKPETPWKIVFALISPLMIGPSFGLYHNYIETIALEKSGQWTKAIVINEKYSGGKTKSMMIKCTYTIEERTYETNFEKDKVDKFSIGDTLELICLKDFPKIYRLENEWGNK